MEILRVENLVKTYGQGDNIVNAVDNISLSVKRQRKVNYTAPAWWSGQTDKR